MQRAPISCPRMGDMPRAVVFNSHQFLLLTCDEHEGWTGWRSENESTWIAQPDHRPTVECAQYCFASGDDIIYSPRNESNFAIGVTCRDGSLDLYYNDQLVAGNEAACGLASGWSVVDPDSEGRSVLTTNTHAPQRFECSKAPPTTTVLPTEGTPVDNTTHSSIASSPVPSTVPPARTTTLPVVAPRKPKKDMAGSSLETAEETSLIICSTIGGIVLVLFIAASIFILCLIKKRQAGSGCGHSCKETGGKTLEDRRDISSAADSVSSDV
ncbi:hypothetical protein PRIPAC_74929 [Pristionchus pacificus]|uniref:Uncharacterized protein n=1 Tax=Pristionchus pacificus TaxID=54126 RepID=A0A2A6BG07_PRIPA|nr:hypothetical protein PRIPAC_74929 [Pristionchus pacificus]|eukprot:PDM64824.1 hypothetical protein PRIPAC_53080 [Pristionchus pacificus]